MIVITTENADRTTELEKKCVKKHRIC